MARRAVFTIFFLIALSASAYTSGSAQCTGDRSDAVAMSRTSDPPSFPPPPPRPWSLEAYGGCY